MTPILALYRSVDEVSDPKEIEVSAGKMTLESPTSFGTTIHQPVGKSDVLEKGDDHTWSMILEVMNFCLDS